MTATQLPYGVLLSLAFLLPGSPGSLLYLNSQEAAALSDSQSS